MNSMIYSAFRLELAQRRPDISLEAVDLAYEFAKQAHGEQLRYSGEPYIVHPVSVAQILLDLNPDLSTLQAALLHDVTEDTEVTSQEIEATFGAEVAQLVEGMNKLSVVKVRVEDSEAEKWRKMFLAMAKDVRIVFIKLADRLHNMRTLDFVPLQKRERIARETLLVHAAIASRLGMYQIKSELEDLCFRVLYPEPFAKLSEQLAETRARSEECMAYATSQLEQLLFRENVAVELVQGRMKHLWSIFQKMEKKDLNTVDSIYDLFAVRIVLPDVLRDGEEQVAHVYSTLGLIHGEYVPLQDRFKDYIAMAKPNGYRSLHTTVLGLGGALYEEPTEVQIRTLSMHRESELGIASHWGYKLGVHSHGRVDLKRQKALQEALKKVEAVVFRLPSEEATIKRWLSDYQHLRLPERQVVEAWLLEQGLTAEDLMAIRKGRGGGPLSLNPQIEEQLAWLRGLAEAADARVDLNLYPEHIFVLTPQQKVIELPRGATPIDFAYAVHTELGHTMVSAKVNGRIVPFEYELQNGEMVEIVTRKNAQPTRYWLSIVKTASARNKIRNRLNKQEKEGGGLETALPEVKEHALVESLDVAFKKKEHNELVSSALTEKVIVTGEENLPVVFSACCKPRPPYPIIGYVTRGHSIRIHRLSCRELSGLDGARFVSTHWKLI